MKTETEWLARTPIEFVSWLKSQIAESEHQLGVVKANQKTDPAEQGFIDRQTVAVRVLKGVQSKLLECESAELTARLKYELEEC